MVDTLDLKSNSFGYAGSIPASRTIYRWCDDAELDLIVIDYLKWLKNDSLRVTNKQFRSVYAQYNNCFKAIEEGRYFTFILLP